MAKITPNNFLDTVHEVFTNATRQGVLHLYAEGDSFTGRRIRINKGDLFHFGTTGYLGLEQDEWLKRAAVEAMFCYSNKGKGYVPAFVGMDYRYAHGHQVYRQLLYHTVKRAGEMGRISIAFGLTAVFEKKKIGAEITPKLAYIQARDNYSMELLGMMEGGG